MDCQEAVYSNDYYDIIGAITANVAGMEHVCRQDLAYRYAVFYLNREKVPPLSVGAYKYINIPRCFTILHKCLFHSCDCPRKQIVLSWRHKVTC